MLEQPTINHRRETMKTIFENILFRLHLNKTLKKVFGYGFFASKACEHEEPLHFHHDGCPACYNVCNSCYEHELTCDCEGKICKLECNHCDLDYIQTSIYGGK